jgi:hypothetical protein
MRTVGPFLYLIGCLMCLSGCVSSQRICSVHFQLIDHKPHCGGAFPSPEQLKGYDEPITGTVYRIVADTMLKDVRENGQVLELDDQGHAIMSLKAGNYSLVLADKWLSTEDFMQKYGNVDTRLYKLKGGECFEKWKATVDFTFVLGADTSMVFTRKNVCHTYWNPCIEYIGPASP